MSDVHRSCAWALDCGLRCVVWNAFVVQWPFILPTAFSVAIVFMINLTRSRCVRQLIVERAMFVVVRILLVTDTDAWQAQ